MLVYTHPTYVLEKFRSHKHISIIMAKHTTRVSRMYIYHNADTHLLYIYFIEWFTTTFLHTHSCPKWVAEDDWWYIKIRPEAPGVWTKELDPNFCCYWDCGLGKSAGASSLSDLAGVWNVLARWHLQPGLNININSGSTQTQGGVQSFWT